MSVTLLQGDCLERMKEIPDGSVDMVLCDLPYGTTACKWDSVIPFEPLWAEYRRVTKPNAAIVLFGAEPFSSGLRLSNLRQFRYDWIWEKSSVVGFPNAKKMPLRNIEVISVFYVSLPTYNPQGVVRIDKQRKNGASKMTRIGEVGLAALNGGRFKGDFVQEFTNYPRQTLKFNREHGTVHPTQKPVALLEYLIRTYTDEGQTVLDNTMGSGSTGVAAVNTNRAFIGIERDQGYFDIANRRIAEARAEKASRLFLEAAE
jgi:site-specific DNA-methyltransferase (adenine-specific)